MSLVSNGQVLVGAGLVDGGESVASGFYDLEVGISAVMTGWSLVPVMVM